MTREALERQEANTGRPQEALDMQPELTYSQALIWEAFCYLNATRESGFNGPLPIKLSEMIVCVDITLEDKETLLQAILYLDAVWLKDWQKKHPGK